MLCSNLSKEITRCKKNESYYLNAANQKTLPKWNPQKSDYEIEYSTFLVPGGFASAGIIVGFWLWSDGLRILPWVPWAFALLMSFVTLIGYLDEVSKRDELYNRDLKSASFREKQNERILRERPQNYINLDNSRKQLSALQTRLNEARTLLNKLYNVNIIPSRYRNIYAVYYLFDYFTSSGGNDGYSGFIDQSNTVDLDIIIQTLLLDEIKQQLSKIIEQNEQILINSRVQIALQEQNNRAQAIYHREQMQKYIELQSNQQMQITYQNMLLRNQEVTNFFLADEFFRRNR